MTTLADAHDCQLRIHRSPEEQRTAEAVSSWVDSVDRFCHGFQEATGWPLLHVRHAGKRTGSLWSAPVDPGVGDALGHLTIGARLSRGETAKVQTGLDQAKTFAAAAVPLIGELFSLRRALAEREADLAAAGPVVVRPQEAVHLAERLVAVLGGIARGLGCRAAALYLLDAATTELKLRSAWGLPPARLADPARPLQGALADLEALTGHAVVLEEPQMMGTWSVPESCQAAVCVPVATATTILGTCWLFSDQPRKFRDEETNLMEIVAGRLAADLEREALVGGALDAADQNRQYGAAGRNLQAQLPQTPPLVDGWELAGWTAAREGLDGNFHDWFALPGDRIGFAVGRALDDGAALVAQTVRAAVRAHAEHVEGPGDVLSRTGALLYRGSAGDQFAAASYGTLDPENGTLRLAAAGPLRALLMTATAEQELDLCPRPLGVEPDSEFEDQWPALEPGDLLLVTTCGDRDFDEQEGIWNRFLEVLADRQARQTLSADALARRLRDAVRDEPTDRSAVSLLVIRRPPA